MKQPHHPAIRTLLRQHYDGLTIKEICHHIPAISKPWVAQKCLEAMPDAYVDRWIGPVRGQWVQVWCVVVPPANCPRPDLAEHKAKTRWLKSAQGVFG